MQRDGKLAETAKSESGDGVLIQSDTVTNVGSNCNWQRLSGFSVNYGHNGPRFHYQA
jgi:hypothetical protein